LQSFTHAGAAFEDADARIVYVMSAANRALSCCDSVPDGDPILELYTPT
jgi:hypothetical protein